MTTEKCKTIYRFHTLVFDIVDSNLNVSTEWLITIGCGNPFQSNIIRSKINSCLCSSLTRRDNERREMHICPYSLSGGLSLSFSVIATFLFAILYIKSSQASLCLSSRQCQFKCYNMSPTLGLSVTCDKSVVFSGFLYK